MPSTVVLQPPPDVSHVDADALWAPTAKIPPAPHWVSYSNIVSY